MLALAEATSSSAALVQRSCYVFCVEPRTEYKVARDCRGRGFDVDLFETCRWAWRRTLARQNTVKKTEILFPGYVFVWAAQHEIGAILNLNGVQYPLPRPELPLPIESVLIEQFRLAEKTGCFDVTRKPLVGTSVEFIEGIYAGIVTKIVEVLRNARSDNRQDLMVKVIVPILGGERPVRTSIWNLREA